MTDSTPPSVDTMVTDQTIAPEAQLPPPILTQQVGQFYQFMFTCMVEWRQLCMVSHDDIETRNTLAVPDYVRSVDTSRYRSFLDYWSYRLYHEYGVKRRIHKYGPDDLSPPLQTPTEVDEETQVVDEETESDDTKNLRKFYGKSTKLLVQFFYDKSLRGYDKHKPITQLCRHLVFDMSSLRIVSLGVTKSFDYDFMANNIMGANQTANALCDVRIEEFLEGTMVVYNPTLEGFGQQALVQHMDAEEAEDQDRENKMTVNVECNDTSANVSDNNDKDTPITESTDDTKSSKQHKLRDLGFSTRRKLGTSYFNNPGMTFAEMFKANNETTGVDLQSWSDEFRNSHCFVFNVEHIENKIINPTPENRNTLVALYKLVDPCVSRGFPSPSGLITAFMQENPMQFSTDQETQQHLGVLMQGLWSYGTACITQIPPQYLTEYVKNALQSGVTDTNNTESVATLPRCSQLLSVSNATTKDIKKLVYSIIKGQTKYHPGVMIYHTITGARSKIRNTKYSELLELKGNLPITVSERNRRNLFKLYWKLRQRKDGSVSKFLKEFDTEDRVYYNIFEWFKSAIHAMTNNLYLEYMSVFVEKTKPAPQIPYEFKPLCGELHKAYLSNRKPTTPQVVMNFVNNMPYFQVYWRLFGLRDGGQYQQTPQYQAEASATITELTNSTKGKNVIRPTHVNKSKNHVRQKYNSNKWISRPPMTSNTNKMPTSVVEKSQDS